jgi:acetoin utilization deacetylase AcuC-like enzyme
MILYDPHHRLSLREFGITIPVRNTKATRTFDHLQRHPVLGPKRSQWWQLPGPETLTAQDLLRAHRADYVNRLFGAQLTEELMRTYELVDEQGNYHRYNPEKASEPLAKLFDRLLERAAGTLQCCRRALSEGFCYYFGGGMHHAQAGFGSGFCLINDVVIAIRKLQHERLITHAWVVDTDAHKGDGTAALTHDDDSILTLSIHMARGWPLDQPEIYLDGSVNPSHIPSTVDIPMAEGADDQYVDKLSHGLHQMAQHQLPDLVVVVAGADPYAKDELPSTSTLKLSLEQLLRRDQLVYRFFSQRGVPQAFLMAGGYGDDTWRVYTQFLEWVLQKRYP